ncbi:hypothetical protein DXG01_011681 [Tephrocybe rancida]|nr:hypothetical protein DXG01_011681 [Tephrocybe rancida]
MASGTSKPGERYSIQRTLETPAHVSCLAFGHAGHLFAGADDGSLRVYDLSSFKVIKAVRGLGEEISSLVCVKRTGSELRDVWLASGRRIMKFQMDSPKMIQTADDALSVVDVSDPGQEDDILNEIALNANKTYIAFSMDSGAVGVVDLATKLVTRMKSKHDSVCGSVKFIPDRPRELVSGGYDTTLLHFDYHEGKPLSTRKMPLFQVADGMALSPPFIMSTTISSTGIIAAGTADGRLFIGSGGYKAPQSKSGKKKRSRKWEGLNENREYITKEAEGPIVALTFDDSGVLTASTLLGVLSRYEVVVDDDEESVTTNKIWQGETQNVKKVNALVVDEKRVVVGGLTAEGKGVIEIRKREIDCEISIPPQGEQI